MGCGSPPNPNNQAHNVPGLPLRLPLCSFLSDGLSSTRSQYPVLRDPVALLRLLVQHDVPVPPPAGPSPSHSPMPSAAGPHALAPFPPAGPSCKVARVQGEHAAAGVCPLRGSCGANGGHPLCLGGGLPSVPRLAHRGGWQKGTNAGAFSRTWDLRRDVFMCLRIGPFIGAWRGGLTSCDTKARIADCWGDCGTSSAWTAHHHNPNCTMGFRIAP